jgi:hypothetical protein
VQALLLLLDGVLHQLYFKNSKPETASNTACGDVRNHHLLFR